MDDARYVTQTMAVWDEDEWKDYPARPGRALHRAAARRPQSVTGPMPSRPWLGAVLAVLGPVFSRRAPLRRA